MLCFVKINSILFNPLCVWILFIRVSLFSGSCSSSWYWTSVTGTSRLLFMGVSAVAVLTVYGSQHRGCTDCLWESVLWLYCLWESALWLYWLFMGVSAGAVLFMGVSAGAVLTVYGSQRCGCTDCLCESALWLYWLFMGVSTVAVLTVYGSQRCGCTDSYAALPWWFHQLCGRLAVTGTSRLLFMGVSAVAVLIVYGSQHYWCTDNYAAVPWWFHQLCGRLAVTGSLRSVPPGNDHPTPVWLTLVSSLLPLCTAVCCWPCQTPVQRTHSVSHFTVQSVR